MPEIPGSHPKAEGPETGERRRARSDDPLRALSHLLESTRARAGLDAVVLADDLGLTVAGGGAASLCDALSAEAALVWAGRPANDTVPCRLDVLTRTARVRRLTIDGVELLLCGEGSLSPSEQDLASAIEGCRRILEGRTARLRF